jgi:hypothetical protein
MARLAGRVAGGSTDPGLCPSLIAGTAWRWSRACDQRTDLFPGGHDGGGPWLGCLEAEIARMTSSTAVPPSGGKTADFTVYRFRSRWPTLKVPARVPERRRGPAPAAVLPQPRSCPQHGTPGSGVPGWRYDAGAGFIEIDFTHSGDDGHRVLTSAHLASSRRIPHGEPRQCVAPTRQP